MQANEFDELLKDKYDDYTPPYNEKAWVALSEKLPVSTPRRSIAIWPLSLGIAASLGAAIMFLLLRPTTGTKDAHPGYVQKVSTQPQSSNITSQSSNTTPQSSNTTPQSSNTTPQSSNTTPQSSNTTPQTYTTTSSAYSTTLLQPNKPSFSQTSRIIAARSVSFAKAQPALSNAKELNSNALNVVANDPSVAANTISSSKEENQQTIANNYRKGTSALIDPLPAYGEKKIAPKTTISLAGGLQYGTLNAGYAAGVNVRHRLSSRWSIESDISYVKYGSTGLEQPPSTAFRGTAQNTALAAQTAPEPERVLMQYIQATPGIAYSVTNGISIGAAVDMQRSLQSTSEETVQTQNADLKQLPLLDIGAAGRAEFSISKRIKAGLIYRQGVNNLLQSGHNYLDRRYIQVQLRVPLVSR